MSGIASRPKAGREAMTPILGGWCLSAIERVQGQATLARVPQSIVTGPVRARAGKLIDQASQCQALGLSRAKRSQPATWAA